MNATRGDFDHIPSKPDVELELEGRMDIKQQLHVNCNNEDILENNLELDLNDLECGVEGFHLQCATKCQNTKRRNWKCDCFVSMGPITMYKYVFKTFKALFKDRPGLNTRSTEIFV